MDKEIIKIHSPIQLSEINTDKPYIVLTTRLCYLDELNLNGVGLSSKVKQECFDSLLDMPIVAKINKKGDKFGSHEVKIDANGNMKFGTNAYGTHVEVWIEDDEVEINGEKRILPCLFAKSKVWKRFENVVSLIINKIENPDKYGGGLFSSWELQGGKHHKYNNGKIYDEFWFLSNCLIDVMPAYAKNSKTIAIASKENNKELSFSEAIFNAFVKDINTLINQGGNEMAKNITEQSALTINDLRKKLWDLVNPKGWSSNPFYSIWNIYPEEHQFICQNCDNGAEDELIVYSYSVDENDNVTLGESKVKKLSDLLAEKMNVNISMNLDDTAKLLSEKEVAIKELQTNLSTKEQELESVNNELSEKVESVNKLGDEISELKKQVEELTPFKEQIEKAEAEKKEAEIAQKKEDLKQLALKGGYITEEELETSEEIKKMIEDIDEKSIKVLRAERIEKKLEEGNLLQTNTNVAQANLDNTDDGISISATSLIKSWIKSK